MHSEYQEHLPSVKTTQLMAFDDPVQLYKLANYRFVYITSVNDFQLLTDAKYMMDVSP